METNRSDEELARLAAAGSEDAFAELFRRNFPRLYDFALRLARDRDTAGAAVQSASFRLLQSLRNNEPQALPFRLQLFALTHHELTQRLRRRSAQVLEGEEAFASAEPIDLANQALAPELPDLARQAWQANRELRLGDQELLDLTLRQKLATPEIASVVGAKQEEVEGRLARVREELEQTFSALLLLGRGRRECLDLDFLVGEAQWSASTRRRVLGHVQGCQLCQGTRRRYPNAVDLLAIFSAVPPPAGWQETILQRLLEAARTGTEAPAPMVSAAPPPGGLYGAGGGGGGIGGWFRNLSEGNSRGPLLIALGGLLLVVIIVFSALCTAGAFDSADKPEPTASPTITETPTETVTGTPSPSVTPTDTPLPPPTSTPLPPTATPLPPTATPLPPTATPLPPSPTP